MTKLETLIYLDALLELTSLGFTDYLNDAREVVSKELKRSIAAHNRNATALAERDADGSSFDEDESGEG